VRPFVCFTVAILAAACVQSEDSASQKDSAMSPEPAAQPAPPSQPNQRRLKSPRLDPNRAMPTRNPFALSDAAAGDATAAAAKGPNGAATTPAPSGGRPTVPPPGIVAAANPALKGQPGAAAPAAPTPAPAAAPDSAITSAFVDNFDRAELGPEWNATSPEWRIQGGQLCGRNARNHPVWLRRKLPTNARVEFDAVSSSPDGDLKVEIWGDGKGFAKGTSYTDATSYLFIYGGWKNQFHVLARIDEHAKGRPEVKVNASGSDLRARPVKQGQRYHFKVERADGKTVRWFVDDIEVLSFADPEPLKGAGHEHLGFNDWEVPVCFDNLQITPLSGG